MSITAAEASDLFRRAPERFIDVGGGTAAACRSVGEGPDVLFVHGWPVTGATFRSLLPLLADHVRCHVLDLPGAGDSRFDATSPVSIELHITAVRGALDALGLPDVAVVGHDSGGLIARHALAGDPRVRAFGLIDTEQPQGLTSRFRSFLMMRHLPGIGPLLGWAVGHRRVRRNRFLLGDVFVDRSRLDGEFDEFFLRPIHESSRHRDAALKLLRSFDRGHVTALEPLHRQIEVPVQMVWGERDAFFPVAWARDMVATFPHARLTVVPDAGLFSHEERPDEVAAALLPVLTAPR